MEVTKWLKPSISVSRIGDRASVQAASRVNAEQASHDEAWVKRVVISLRQPVSHDRSRGTKVPSQPRQFAVTIAVRSWWLSGLCKDRTH